VAGDRVFVVSDAGTLYAFSATGTAGCSGEPRSCAPLWTASVGSVFLPPGSPLVADGIVYVQGDALYAFDAAGAVGCSGTPSTCAPLWTAASPTRGATTPALVDGVLYAMSLFNLHAFDAAGDTNCGGTPRVCAPLWTATWFCNGVITCEFSGSPAVVEGTVYVATEQSDELLKLGALFAFDAAGVEACSGRPPRCEPLWIGYAGAEPWGPAVVGDTVYVTDYERDPDGGNLRRDLLAYDGSTTTHCYVDPEVDNPPWCPPIWSSDGLSYPVGPPSVANGVVYAINSDGSVLAFDAAGVRGCRGAPTVCDPVWVSAAGIGWVTAPTPANGHLYVGGRERLNVFGLP
jgi:outer membrane protein assembly factor BamB